MRKLTKNEKLLVELVHFISYGDKKEFGLTLREVNSFLVKPISNKDDKNALECLDIEGKQFINELKLFINSIEDS